MSPCTCAVTAAVSGACGRRADATGVPAADTLGTNSLTVRGRPALPSRFPPVGSARGCLLLVTSSAEEVGILSDDSSRSSVTVDSLLGASLLVRVRGALKPIFFISSRAFCSDSLSFVCDEKRGSTPRPQDCVNAEIQARGTRNIRVRVFGSTLHAFGLQNERATFRNNNRYIHYI